MSCEEANKEFVESLNAWVRVEEELKDLLLSYVGTPGHPGEPIIPGSEKFERVERLMEESPKAHERHRAALVAYIEAKKRHRD